MYFALVSRVHLQLEQVGPEGGLITSPQVSQVQAVFPEGALQKRIKIGVQAQKVPPEQLQRAAGSRVTVSPIVTIEPRRRKFHRPITLAIPMSKHYEPAQINMQPPESQTLRLLCSITGALLLSPRPRRAPFQTRFHTDALPVPRPRYLPMHCCRTAPVRASRGSRHAVPFFPITDGDE